MREYSTGLYRETETYWCHSFKNRDEWLAGRGTLRGVGGSDSAAALGMSKWKTNLILWREKTHRSEPSQIETPQMRYGIDAEEPIRNLYQLDVEGKYEVQYKPDCILQSKKWEHMLYSPDGLLMEIGTGRVGLLEIKTSTIHGNADQWKDQIPQNYFIQVVHGMAVTGAVFAELRAHLRYSEDYTAVKTYHIERAEIGPDIDVVTDGVDKFWRYVQADEEPPLIIGGLRK